MNAFLIRPLLDDEVKEVVFSIHLSKMLGKDGLIGLFVFPKDTLK